MNVVRAADSDYARFARPKLMQLLAACRLDKVYHRGEGDLLWTRDETGHEVEILDMVGGFGVGLLGHNPPELVEVMRQALAEKVPFHAQGSHREAAGRLCRRLSELAGAPTGRRYIVTLTNSGTEAVEAAIKHAELERDAKVKAIVDGCRERHRSIQEKLRNRACRIVPRVLSGVPGTLGLPSEVEPDVEELYHEILRHNLKIAENEPIFLALEGAFHGKTTGSLKLTHNPSVRLPFQGIGIRVRFLPLGDTAALEAAVREATLTYLDLEIDPSGAVSVAERGLVNIAAIFVEPIQGEGGIRIVGKDYLAAVRRIASESRFPLVLDEIQCGCGRTGTFLASTQDGVAGDYVVLSKALGGGLTKVAALLVDEERYREEFGTLHTSTFAEDEISSRVALAALDRIAGDGGATLDAVKARGERLISGLLRLRQKYPHLIVDVRGRGLMIGIEFARCDDSDSPTIRVLSSQGHLAFVVAGYLLHAAGIRVLPTLSRPETIRIQPSARISEEMIDQFLDGMERVCRVLDLDRSDQLIRYLCVEDPAAAPPEPAGVGPVDETRPMPVQERAALVEKTLVVRRRATRPTRADAIPAYSGRVSFLGHFIRPGHMRRWDPALSDFSDEELARYLDRTHRVLDPFVSETAVVESVTGEKVHLSFIGIPLTPDHMHRAFQEGDVRWVEEKILAGVRLARRLGSGLVGLGGYTSILTGQGTHISEDRLGITSGNAMTVAMGVEALKETAAEMGIDLAGSTLGAVGATGNICSLYAQMMAEEVPRIVLVGRPQMESRVRNVASEIYFECFKILRREPDVPHRGVTGVLARTHTYRRVSEAYLEFDRVGPRIAEGMERELGGDSPIRIETEPDALVGCNLIVTASSTPEPVIYPRHLGPGPRLICDLAVPEDTAPEVLSERPDVRVIRGGIVRLPGGRGIALAGVPLEPDCVFACMAETLVLGLSRTTEHFSWGRVTKRHVERIGDMARYHGFTLERPAMEAPL
ncbi:MAG: aminotransferase class III-fold pyridoxal phosphate-dependent enzyme [Planctomycetes bacterium]|nr:aminotransferase class III-fold pyridoxal phosphate-dependent enzyme [Planctomycetota bacterium]